jgi:hypothetical protein
MTTDVAPLIISEFFVDLLSYLLKKPELPIFYLPLNSGARKEPDASRVRPQPHHVTPHRDWELLLLRAQEPGGPVRAGCKTRLRAGAYWGFSPASVRRFLASA